MQEKFCRLHSLLSRSERRRILKYSCSRPAGCLQSAPGSTPGAEQGVNGARGAGAPGPAVPSTAGQFLPGKRRLPGAAGNHLQRGGGARERPVPGAQGCGVKSAGMASAGCGVRDAE